MCDDNGDALPLPILLNGHARRCKMTHVINRDEAHGIGHECSCSVFTLNSTYKHTYCLAHDMNELDLHPDLDFRSLGRQEKRGRPKKKRCRCIRILYFNYACRFAHFALLVMSFLEIEIRLFLLLGAKVQNLN